MTRKDKLKYALKVIFAYLLYFTGILHLYKVIRLRNKAVVLMYHRVLSEADKKKSFSHDGIIVDKDTFEKHIRFLRKTFNVVSLNEFSNRIQSRVSFEKFSCLITFDDGWRDNFINAYPILKKYKIPAVVFLPVNYIGTDNLFWQERLTRMLHSICCNAGISKQGLLDKFNLKGFSRLPDEELRLQIKEYVNQKKDCALHDIQKNIFDILKDYEPFISVIDNVDTFLDWDQVKYMSIDGISFGSHGVNHKILTKVPSDEVSEEIMQSRKVIEGQLSTCPITFSYPNGNFDENIISLVKACGYQLAFSTEKGFVSSSDNPFAIKRINIHNDITKNIPLFLTRILGVF